MRTIINHDEQERRCRCMRKWYFGRKDSRSRSVERRKVLSYLGITSETFYNILSGRTYINDTDAQSINRVVNRFCIPGWEVDIFAK